MSLVQWSYSSWKTFRTCARQYKHKFILKDVTDPGNEAAHYGTEVHAAIEHYLRDGMPMPDAYQRFLPTVDAVKAWPGEFHVEKKMALNGNLAPCEFKHPDYFVRGIADLVVVDGRRARILDWKTGKSAKYADIKQIELMALMTFKHFPQVEMVRGGLVFLVPDKIVEASFARRDEKSMWLRWLYEMSVLEQAIEKDNFGPNPNSLCRAYCPVMTCEYNGRA